MFRLPLALGPFLLALPLEGSPPEDLDAVFLDNGEVRLGVDRSSGASVFFFGESEMKRNFLNHYDRGRFVQQSFYGRPDDSSWNGKPWRWNPVQGGNWKGRPSRLDAFTTGENSIYARTTPHHWAADHLIEEATMEQWITLDGPVASIRYRFRYEGDTAHPRRDQEVPAVFMDSMLKTLVYYGGEAPWTGGAVTKVVPGWPNEERTATEGWAAYVDGRGEGCGLYFPSQTRLTTYRHPGPSGPKGSGCSYFAPLATIAIERGLSFDYEVYLTIGSVPEIRKRFRVIRDQRVAAAAKKSTEGDPTQE